MSALDPRIGDVFERNGVRLEVDAVRFSKIYCRRWRTGSDGSRQSDWDHFIDALAVPREEFVRQVQDQ